MYKILNYLFGWDYVSISSERKYADPNGIFRVIRTPNLDVGFVYSPGMEVGRFIKITDPTQVIWLTCSSDKYFGPKS